MFNLFKKREIEKKEMVEKSNEATKRDIINLIDKKIAHDNKFPLNYHQTIELESVIKEIENEYNVKITYTFNDSIYTSIILNIIYYNIEDIKEMTKQKRKQLIEVTIENIRNDISKYASNGYNDVEVFIEENLTKEVIDTLRKDGYEVYPSPNEDEVIRCSLKGYLWIISWA